MRLRATLHIESDQAGELLESLKKVMTSGNAVALGFKLPD